MSPVTVYNARPPKRGPAIAGVVVMLALLAGAGAFLVSLRGADDGLASVDAADVQETSATTPQLAPPISPETTTTLHDLAGRDYRSGDCVIWDEDVRQRRDADTHVVDCLRLHFIEMTAHVELPARYDAPFPSDEQWDAILEERCGPLAVQYLGYPLWPNGRFHATGLHPVAQGWKFGDRDLWCGIGGLPAEGPAPVGESAFAGRVKGQDQTRINGAGTCLTDAGEYLDPIACDQPHAYEVIGSIDLAGRPGVERPADQGDPDDPLRRECRVVAATYLGRPVKPGEWPSWLTISEEDWTAGRRRLECVVSRWEPGAPAPTIVTGPRLGG